MIRRLRRGAGLTQQSLADRAGCTKGYLSAIETGRKLRPSARVLERLEASLGVTPGSLAALAAWTQTPGTVRLGLARLRDRDALLERLAEIAGAGGDAGARSALDELYHSGELHRLFGERESRGDGREQSAARAALPFEVPLINKVAAGYPTEFTDLGYPARVADEYVRCPDVEDPDAFAARVVGDSMEPAYFEGDIVVFSPARPVRDGDDCFARLEPDHESTFKRVYFEGDDPALASIRLQPVNSRYAPRVVPREHVAGLYRAVTVVRML